MEPEMARIAPPGYSPGRAKKGVNVSPAITSYSQDRHKNPLAVPSYIVFGCEIGTPLATPITALPVPATVLPIQPPLVLPPR